MGLSYLIAGFVFFFFPNFNIMDVLPDFIGCILIIKGLYKLSDLTPGLLDAKNAFIKALYIYLAKFVLMFTVPFFGNSDGGYILIFTFTFAVLDLIFVLPAFKTLLNGFLYLGNRTNAKVLFKNQSEFSTLTSIFLFVRALLAVIPDLSYISNPDYSGVVSSERGFYISDYKNMLVGVNFLITGVLGVIWLCYAIKYISTIKKDKQLISFLDEKYNNEIVPNEGLFIRRSIKKAFLFISIGAFFMPDLQIDLVNVIPDFFGALMFVLAALVLRKYCETKIFTIYSVIFAVTSGAAWITSCIYAVRFPAVNIWSNYKAYEFYVYVNIANVIKYISLGIVFIALYKTLNSVIEKHTGSSINDLKAVSASKLQKQKLAKKTNKLVLFLGFISIVFSITKTAVQYSFGEFAVFDFLVNVVLLICIVRLLNTVNEAVEYKYL